MSIPEDVMKTAAAVYRQLGRGSLPDTDTIARALMAERVAATNAERERGWGIARAYEGKPCGPAQLWTEEQRQFFDAGQVDASNSIAAAIRNA